MTDLNNEPRALSPDDVEMLKKQRELLLPAARIAAYDEYAKWLFTIITVVGTLGAAFSNPAFKGLKGMGAFMFALAIGSTGIALALAIVSRTIEVTKVNFYSLPDIFKKGLCVLRCKIILSWATAGFFAFALLLAGISPAFSGEPSSLKSFSYVLGKDGLHVTGSIPKPAGTAGQVIVSVISSKGESVLGNQTTTADKDGVMKFDLTSSPIPADATAVKLLLNCDLKKNQKQEFQIVPSSAASATGSPSTGCID